MELYTSSPGSLPKRLQILSLFNLSVFMNELPTPFIFLERTMNNTEVIRRNGVYRGCYTLMKDWATWNILKRQSEQHIRWRDRGRKVDWSYKVKDSWNIARKLWKSYLCFVTQACKTRYSEGCRNITSLKTACSSKWVQEQPEQGRKTLSQHTKLKIKYKKRSSFSVI